MKKLEPGMTPIFDTGRHERVEMWPIKQGQQQEGEEYNFLP